MTYLNYCEMLFEKLTSLPPVVSSADARPTTQSYDVFQKLIEQIDPELAKLESLLSNELQELNDKLTDAGPGPIGI